jgi:hypothetical protein
MPAQRERVATNAWLMTWSAVLTLAWPAGRRPMAEPCEEASLLSLLQQIEAAHQQLEDYLAVEMPPRPRRAAEVLTQLRVDLIALTRRTAELWKDAHNQDIEQEIRRIHRDMAATGRAYLTVVPPEKDE